MDAVAKWKWIFYQKAIIYGFTDFPLTPFIIVCTQVSSIQLQGQTQTRKNNIILQLDTFSIRFNAILRFAQADHFFYSESKSRGEQRRESFCVDFSCISSYINLQFHGLFTIRRSGSAMVNQLAITSTTEILKRCLGALAIWPLVHGDSITLNLLSSRIPSAIIHFN